MTVDEASPTPDGQGEVSRARRWVLAVGIALILGGAAVLGYAAWEYYGTTVVSHHRQREGIEQVERAWQRGETSATTDWGTVGAIAHIPRFGDEYAVPIIEGTSDDALAAGLGHFSGTAGPGAVGNFALAGHRITHGQPLREMPDLRVGDVVEVETASTTFVYRLTSAGNALEVRNDASWVLDPVPDNPRAGGVEPPQVPGQHLLTLTTCAELFHTDERLVAFGVLESTAARG